MRKRGYVAAAAMALCAGTSVAGAPVKVLGIEMAGAPLPKLPRCVGEIPRKVKAICASSAPFVASDGSSLVDVDLPGASERPSWSEFALFKLNLDKSRRVQVIAVDVMSDLVKHDIAKSVSDRFGPPIQTDLTRNDVVNTAEWLTPDVHVWLACRTIPQRICTVRFESRDSFDAAARAREDREKGRRPL